MSHVFISYSHHDSEFVTLLRLQLEQIGISVWLDTEGLSAGEEWRDAIDRAIRGAYAVIVVITSTARKSEYVTYEWSCAWGAGVPLIPVILEATELHPRLEAIQHFNFTDPKKRQWDKLFARLSDIAGATFTVNAPYDSPRYIREYARQLDLQHDPVEITKVIEALTNTDDPAAIEVLASASKHRNRVVRFQAALALAQVSDFTDPRCVQTLVEFVVKRNWVPAELIKKWRTVFDQEAAVARATSEILVKYVHTLGKLRDRRASAALLQLLEEEGTDFDVGVEAIISLGEIREVDAVPKLIDILSTQEESGDYLPDSTAKFYKALIEALGRIPDSRVVCPLVEALKHQALLSDTIDILTVIGTPAINILAEKLDDEGIACHRGAYSSWSSDQPRTPVTWSSLAAEVLVKFQTSEALEALNEWRRKNELPPVEKD